MLEVVEAGGLRGTHVTNGSSAQGGYGGGLGWKNNISVTPGQTYTVVVGSGGTPPASNLSNDQGGDGGDSYFVNATTVKGEGGSGGLPGSDSSVVFQMAEAGYVGDGGGYGGRGGVGQDFTGSPNNTSGGGGGAGGYSGNGGDGGDADAPSTYTSGDAGSGGAGGGGSSAGISGAGHRIGSGGGGGVGLLGEGSSGTFTSTPTSGSGTYGGKGGSGGADAADNPWSSGNGYLPGSDGGLYGGGGGGQAMSYGARPGAGGAVRIMWGPGRLYPSSNTENFTPRSAEENNTCTDISGKGNNATLSNGVQHTDGPFSGAGYVEFDGTGDNLSISSTSSLGGFSGDFTIEFWFKGGNQNVYAVFLESWVSFTNSTQKWAIQAEGSGPTNMIWVRDGLPRFTTSGIDVFDNAWHHHAVVRDGSTITYYIDGVSRGSETHSAALTPGTDFIIGEFSTGNYEIEGYLSNVRIVEGTAIYTTTFIPPTKSLTAVPGTKTLDLSGKYHYRCKF